MILRFYPFPKVRNNWTKQTECDIDKPAPPRLATTIKCYLHTVALVLTIKYFHNNISETVFCRMSTFTLDILWRCNCLYLCPFTEVRIQHKAGNLLQIMYEYTRMRLL